MKFILFIPFLFLLCGCASVKTTDHGPRTTDLPPLPPEITSHAAASLDCGASEISTGTFSVGEGSYTPGPLHLDTPHLVSQTDAQFPVDVFVDKF